jgi:RHS repeat-associated protein
MRREEYTAYGETTFGSYGRKRYRYTAKECDEESGLYYVGNRYYAPWLSRWIGCDPSGLATGTNLYVFCDNNPLTLRDDDGAAPKLPPGARVHVFQQKGKDAQGHQVEGYSKVVRAPGGKPAAQGVGNSAGTNRARGSPATTPGTGHGNDATTVPGSKTGVVGGAPGGTGTERGPGTGGAGGGGDGGTGGSPQGVGATGSPQGSPTGSATSNGGSPNGITDPDRHKKSSGEGGTGITGKGSGSLSQMDLAVLIAHTASDPLQAAVDGATEKPEGGKSGGLPEGNSKDAAGNEAVQGLYVAAKAIKAALSVAVMAVGATAKGGAQAIKIGSGKAYSVLHQVRLKPTGKISMLPKKMQRLIHWSRAQRALNKEMKNNPVLKKAVMQARAKGQWVWHHSSEEGGLMELVPAVQHRASVLQDLFHPYVVDGRRVGGFFLWGDLYN